METGQSFILLARITPLAVGKLSFVITHFSGQHRRPRVGGGGEAKSHWRGKKLGVDKKAK